MLDLFSRKAVGWAMSHSLATELVNEALRHAVRHDAPPVETYCTTVIEAVSTPATTTNTPCKCSASNAR